MLPALLVKLQLGLNHRGWRGYSTSQRSVAITTFSEIIYHHTWTHVHAAPPIPWNRALLPWFQRWVSGPAQNPNGSEPSRRVHRRLRPVNPSDKQLLLPTRRHRGCWSFDDITFLMAEPKVPELLVQRLGQQSTGQEVVQNRPRAPRSSAKNGWEESRRK